MIKLSDSDIVGIGTNRACYKHPYDINKCIKVTISGDYRESNKEKKYYTFLNKRKVSFDFVAQYYGVVETDLGEGLVFELITDYTGKVSKPISFYFNADDDSDQLLIITKKLIELKKYLIKEKIIVKDLSFVNILYQKLENTENRLVIIDGVINNEFFPLSTYVDYFTIKKINRRWDFFIKKISRKYPKVFNMYTELEN